MDDMLYKDECYAIIGACFAVYNDMGCGFSEPIYQECLEIEMEYLGIPFAAQPPQRLSYRGRKLKHRFIPDFICYDHIVIEIKAVSSLCDEHRSQMLNYLNACNMPLGLLVNFGHYPKLEYERIILQTART